MLPISIILVSAEVGQARLRVKPGNDSIMGGELIGSKDHGRVS
jgi:hypothetical protein